MGKACYRGLLDWRDDEDMSESRHNKNLRELFSLYPLGCESFGAEWLRRWEEGIDSLLRQPAKIEVFDEYGPNGWYEIRVYDMPLLDGKIELGSKINSIAHALIAAIHEWSVFQTPVRVSLLNGTIIREYGKP